MPVLGQFGDTKLNIRGATAPHIAKQHPPLPNPNPTLPPTLPQACTSFVGFTLGDVLAQNFVEPSDAPYDYMRTARLASFGLLVHGTSGHFFYKFLDGRFTGTAMKTVATKVAVDQTVWNPVFGVMFFSYLNLVEGKSLGDLTAKMKENLPTAVMGSWVVWVPAHFVNFRFVPPQQRLLYINTIQIFYNIFLSVLGNNQVGEEEKGEKEEL